MLNIRNVIICICEIHKKKTTCTACFFNYITPTSLAAYPLPATITIHKTNLTPLPLLHHENLDRVRSNARFLRWLPARRARVSVSHWVNKRKRE